MRIAIPVTNGILSRHIARCESFAFVDVNDGRAAGGLHEVVAPPHAANVLPGWLAQLGADLVISSGMSTYARHLFEYHGVRVILGAEFKSPTELATAFLAGSLEAGEPPRSQLEEPDIHATFDGL